MCIRMYRRTLEVVYNWFSVFRSTERITKTLLTFNEFTSSFVQTFKESSLFKPFWAVCYLGSIFRKIVLRFHCDASITGLPPCHVFGLCFCVPRTVAPRLISENICKLKACMNQTAAVKHLLVQFRNHMYRNFVKQ